MLFENVVELLTRDKSFGDIRTHRFHLTLNPRCDSLIIKLGDCQQQNKDTYIFVGLRENFSFGYIERDI
jgi:hypothetical protein